MQDGRRHLQALGHGPQGEALITKKNCLVKIDLGGGPSTVLAREAGSINPGLRAASNLPPFFFGEPTKDRDQQRADRTTSVEPRLSNTDEIHAEAVETQYFLNVADQAAAEAIKGEDHDVLEGTAVCSSLELLPFGPDPRGTHVLFEYRYDVEPPRSGQLLHCWSLVFSVLPVGRAPEVDGGL